MLNLTFALLLTLAGQVKPFPKSVTSFETTGQIVFTGESSQWDQQIRERGWILKHDGQYYLWYTGYVDKKQRHRLGLAKSSDGVTWTRHQASPIFGDAWVEDMMVVKVGDTFHMFAEGENDVAQRLESQDGINWKRMGPIEIRQTNGHPITPGPYGTPTAWHEDGKWWLFYERRDQGVWLATSTDLVRWDHVQDEPVLKRGDSGYDQYAIALNQIVKRDGVYYAYYHGSARADWKEWNVSVARSTDLIHWEKFDGNPIIPPNHSSGILVDTGNGSVFYTMHQKVRRHLPKP